MLIISCDGMVKIKLYGASLVMHYMRYNSTVNVDMA